MFIEQADVKKIEIALQLEGIFYEEPNGLWDAHTQQAYTFYCTKYHPDQFPSPTMVHQPSRLLDIPISLLDLAGIQLVADEQEQVAFESIELPGLRIDDMGNASFSGTLTAASEVLESPRDVSEQADIDRQLQEKQVAAAQEEAKQLAEIEAAAILDQQIKDDVAAKETAEKEAAAAAKETAEKEAAAKVHHGKGGKKH